MLCIISINQQPNIKSLESYVARHKLYPTNWRDLSYAVLCVHGWYSGVKTSHVNESINLWCTSLLSLPHPSHSTQTLPNYFWSQILKMEWSLFFSELQWNVAHIHFYMMWTYMYHKIVQVPGLVQWQKSNVQNERKEKETKSEKLCGVLLTWFLFGGVLFSDVFVLFGLRFSVQGWSGKALHKLWNPRKALLQERLAVSDHSSPRQTRRGGDEPDLCSLFKGEEKKGRSPRHPGNAYLTSFRLVSVRRHDHVNWKSKETFNKQTAARRESTIFWPCADVNECKHCFPCAQFMLRYLSALDDLELGSNR